MLLSMGRISRVQFEQATILQARRGGTMGCHLVRMGAIGDEDLVDMLLERFPVAHYSLDKLRNVDSDLIALVNSGLASDLRVLPLSLDGKTLILGVTDPSRQHVLDETAFQTGLEIVPAIVSESDMDWALGHYYGVSHAVSLMPEKYSKISEPPLSFSNLSEDDVDVMGLRAPSKPSGSSQTSNGVSSPIELEPAFSPDEDSVVMVSSDGWNLNSLDSTQEFGAGSSATPSNSYEDELVSYLQDPPAVGQPEPPMVDSLETDTVDEKKVSRSPIAVRAPIKVGASMPREGYADYPNQSVSSGIREKREMKEGEIIAAIHRGRSRNEIIGLALDYLLQFAARAAFFVVKKNEIKGFEIAGDLTSRSAIRSYWVPLNVDCTLGHVAKERRIHLGPLGRSAADAILAASLGGRPKRILVLPVELRERTVGMIYGDGLNVEMPPWNRLERLAEVVGENFKRLILEREHR